MFFNYYSLCSNLRRKQEGYSFVNLWSLLFHLPHPTYAFSIFPLLSLFPLTHVNTHTRRPLYIYLSSSLPLPVPGILTLHFFLCSRMLKLQPCLHFHFVYKSTSVLS